MRWSDMAPCFLRKTVRWSPQRLRQYGSQGLRRQGAGVYPGLRAARPVDRRFHGKVGARPLSTIDYFSMFE